LSTFGVSYRRHDDEGVTVLPGSDTYRIGALQIIGNVRLDDKASLGALIGRLPPRASDLEICLRAYIELDDAFANRIRGDFSFVIWDGLRRRFLGVRDHLGVRAFFYTLVKETLYASDSIDWILSHKEVPADLDDVWVGDFLIAGFGLDFARSVRRHVSRLAPAHIIDFSATGLTTRRYWRLDIGAPIRLKKRRDYVERFGELLGEAIRDRLPSGRVGIAMSGGLDSTTLAAATVDVVKDPSRIVTECIHYSNSMRDEEGHFSKLVADKLGIELLLREASDSVYDPLWRERGIKTAEPTATIVQAHSNAVFGQRNRKLASVWFFGEGPDDALPFDRNPYLSWLISQRDWKEVLLALADYARVKGTAGWSRTLLRALRPGHRTGFTGAGIPDWISPEFEREMRLSERLADLTRSVRPRHWKPSAIRAFTDPLWPALFDMLRLSEMTGGPEWRHPYLDLRLLQYLISIPTIPWAWRKEILRQAMRHKLPSQVLARDKTPLVDQPLREPLKKHGFPALSGTPGFERYVRPEALPRFYSPTNNLDQVIFAHALDYWLACN
jgi:asparagine synthase (glutamine-hydrolysing)